MIPVRELLSRIRRDKKIGRGEFVIGYSDRVEDAIIHLPLREILVRPDDHFALNGILSPRSRISTIRTWTCLIPVTCEARHSMGNAFGYSCHGSVIKFVR